MEKTQNNILIVDDHEMIREGLNLTLSNLPKVDDIFKAKNGKEALELLYENKSIRIIITDINMPVMNGTELCRNIKNDFPSLKIIVLSQYKEMWMLKDLIKHNVDSILLKEDESSEIEKAIEAVSKSANYYSPDIQQLIVNSISGKKSKKTDFNVSLTKREKEVLNLISNENTNSEIAEKLFISTKTVDCHRNNILLKFGARNTAGLIKKAIQFGLIE